MKYAVIFTFGLICSVLAAKVALAGSFDRNRPLADPIWPQHPSNRYRSVPLRLVQDGYRHE
jgi:hypothetical protein